MFRRIRTAKQYHDAEIIRLEWIPPSDLELSIDLDTHWNPDGAASAILRFKGVKNRSEVEGAIKEIESNRSHDKHFAEIVCLQRIGKQRYLIDTTPQPGLEIECAGFDEI